MAQGGPVALVLTRQRVALIDRTTHGAAALLSRGGYVLAEGTRPAPDLVLMSTGSEVGIALEAQPRIQQDLGLSVRVVSMPSHELFLRQPAAYQEAVLPAGAKRIAIEAAHPMSWHRFLGRGDVMVGIETFGASAPYQRLYTEYGITVERVVETARTLIAR